MNAFGALLKHEIILALRQSGGAGSALSFMLSVLLLVPLSLGPDQNLLQRLAPGIMWLSLLLAVLLTAERIFQQDFEDGTLDGLMQGVLPLEIVVLTKALAHWLSVSLPLALAAPLLGIFLNIAISTIPVLMLSMVLGSFALSLLASIGGAVACGLRRGGLLVSLLTLPLYVPVLVFGISATVAQGGPGSATNSILVEIGIALVAMAIQPWACAAALKAYFK